MAEKEATLLLRIKEIGSEAIDKAHDAFKFLGEAIVAAGVAIAGFATAAIYSYRQSEEASNALTQSMVQQGIYTTELKKKYDDMASALEKTTTFSDEQITAAQALLQSQIGQIPISEKLMKATLDLASAKKIDLSTAAELVGKTIGTETNALARQGIQINQSATESQKLAQVTDELNKKFGGQAEAAGKGLGSITQLKNSFDNIMETIGGKLAPVVIVLTKMLTGLSEEIQKNQDFLDGLDSVIKFVTDGFIGLKEVVIAVGKSIGTILAADLSIITNIMQGNFKQAYEAAKLGVTEIGDAWTTGMQRAADESQAVQAAAVEVVKQKEQEKTDAVKNAAANRATVAAEAAANEQIALMTADEARVTYTQDMQMAELQDLDGFHINALTAKLNFLNAKLQMETDARKKLDLMNAIADTKDKLREEQRAKEQQALLKETLSTISTLQNSHNAALAAAGKAAGIAQIAIDTPIAVAHAMASPIPYPGNMIAAALVGVAMAAQAARLAGVQLAEGGIVKARPGGIQATIGEGGQDEAVIPLSDGMRNGGLGGSTYNFYGPIMGDRDQARQFARMIDEELAHMRKSNESLAFDGAIS